MASCSGKADSLPQWRSYCPNGNGVAIGFQVDCLNRAFVKRDPKDLSFGSHRSLARTLNLAELRTSDHRRGILDTHIEDAMRLSIEEVASLVFHPTEGDSPGDETADYRSAYFKVFIDRAASFIKHPSFSNEDEYRLLVDGVFSAREYLEYRVSRTTLIPYIPVYIPKRHSSAPLVPAGKSTKLREPPFWDRVGESFAPRLDFIDRVVIGPTSDKKLSLAAVSSFFKRRGMSVEVVSSTIPYRDW